MTTETRERHDLDMTGITAVEVATFNGDIVVEAGPGHAFVEAALRGQATYVFERLGTLLYVAAKKRGMTFSGSAASFALHIPAGLALKLATVNGPIRLHGAVRTVAATTYKGAIETRASGRSDLQLTAADGRIDVRGADGRIKATTSNGAIAIADARGQIELTTANGEMRISGVEGQVRAATSNGGMRVEDAAGVLQLASGNGSLRLERITLDPGSKNWAKTGWGTVEVAGLRAPGGLALSAKATRVSYAGLADYEVLHSKGHMLKAKLAGTKPATLEIATAGEIRVTG